MSDFKKLFVGHVGNRFFSVKFKKQNGADRILTGRLGVTKHLKGGSRSATNDKYLIVWESATKGYRYVNIDTLQWIKCRGIKMDVAI
jgi:hypothetical protein|tara:strand:- start:200 stop:460 length:261 start_codon:yes stop_codon:yes gene_type:complete